MKFEDYTDYIMKEVWVKAPYSRPKKGKIIAVEFENERIMVLYTNKYGQEMRQFLEPDEILTQAQYELLNLPKLWDKTVEDVKK